MSSKSKQQSKASKRFAELEYSDDEGVHPMLGSNHGKKTADHGIDDEIQEKTVTTQGAFANYHLYIGIAVIALVVALFWHETNTNRNRLTNLETTVDDLLKSLKAVKKMGEIDTKVKGLDTQIQAASNSLIGFEKKVQAAGSRMNGIDEALNGQEKDLTVVTLDLNEQIEKQKGLKDDLEQINKQLNNVKEKSETIEKSLNTLSMAMKSFEDKITGLDRQFSDSDIKSKDAIKTISILEQRLSSTQREMKDLSNNMSSIGGKLPGFEAKTGEVLSRLVTAEEKVNQLSELDGDVKKLEGKIHGIVKNGYELETKATNLLDNVSAFEIQIQDHGKKLDQYNTDIKEATEKQDSLVEDLDKLRKDTKTTSKNIEEVWGKTNSLKKDLDETEKEVKEKIEIIGKDISNTDTEIKSLTIVVKNIKEYSNQQVPALKNRLDEVEKVANFPYFCVMDILEIIVIIMIILSMRDSTFLSSATTIEGSSGTTRYSSNYVRPQSILGKINRAPVFENKICIVSFYSETLNLHKMMLVAALQNSRRAQGFQIVQNLIKRHEDILEIPNARYIFVFVDFNERNVILENPGQDLGDKKLVTVQAAVKLGATVFVTYVRNKGSRTLPPGVLYNTELTAFTSHFVLKGLTAEGRCFSVYESFSQSQKEHIADAIH